MHLANTARTFLRRQWSRLFEPIDNASLVYFRVAFGAIALWEMWRYADKGWIARYYIEPEFNFTYYGFRWVSPWPGDGMYWHFGALAVLAVCIAIGAFYRVATVLFFIGFTYVFLLERAHYLNHLYFFSLMSLLMCFIPAHRDRSVDTWRNPGLVSETAPRWTLSLLRFQMGIVYFYAGIAKLNGDWLTGWPLRDWLPKRSDFPVIGPWFDEPWVAVAFSYGGLFLDLCGPFLLLWKRTRVPMLLALVCFHLMNARLFTIGIFPWFAIATTLLFLEPDWPRRIFNFRRRAKAERPPPTQWGLKERIVASVLLGHVAFQILVPWRHVLYPGNVAWTDEGHLFSWRMKLRSKSADATFYIIDPETEDERIVDNERYLTRRQERKMSSRPDMIREFAAYLADENTVDGVRPMVRAEIEAALNGRPYQDLVDSDVDLAAEPDGLAPKSWILPLTVERD